MTKQQNQLQNVEPADCGTCGLVKLNKSIFPACNSSPPQKSFSQTNVASVNAAVKSTGDYSIFHYLQLIRESSDLWFCAIYFGLIKPYKIDYTRYRFGILLKPIKSICVRYHNDAHISIRYRSYLTAISLRLPEKSLREQSHQENK